MNRDSYDVIVIGAGPAGSSAATILAENGRRVLVLERERFPRYHIGESLIPFTYQPLERLGMIDQLKESAFTKKYSVQFISPDGKASQPFYFFNRYDRETVAAAIIISSSTFIQMMTVRLLTRSHRRPAGREKTASGITRTRKARVVWLSVAASRSAASATGLASTAATASSTTMIFHALSLNAPKNWQISNPRRGFLLDCVMLASCVP